MEIEDHKHNLRVIEGEKFRALEQVEALEDGAAEISQMLACCKSEKAIFSAYFEGTVPL